MISEVGGNLSDGKSANSVSPFAGPNIPRPTNQPSGKRKQWGHDPSAIQKTNVIGTNFLDSTTPETISRKNDQHLKQGGMKPFSLDDSDDEEETKKPKAKAV